MAKMIEAKADASHESFLRFHLHCGKLITFKRPLNWSEGNSFFLEPGVEECTRTVVLLEVLKVMVDNQIPDYAYLKFHTSYNNKILVVSFKYDYQIDGTTQSDEWSNLDVDDRFLLRIFANKSTSWITCFGKEIVLINS